MSWQVCRIGGEDQGWRHANAGKGWVSVELENGTCQRHLLDTGGMEAFRARAQSRFVTQ